LRLADERANGRNEKGRMMPEINAATGALTIPIWAVGAASAVVLVLIMLAIAQAGTATVMNVLFRVVIIATVVSAAWIYIELIERQEHAAERRSLDERSAALLGRAVAPGSALSCLHELAGETVEAACEKAVFASPEAVSAAVSYIAAELVLLADGSEHARREDPAYGAELAPLRAALQLDRFGIVAHVLAQRYGCTAQKCDTLDRFSDASHVLANLRDHVFDEQVTRFAAVWGSPPHAADAAPAAPAVPLRMAPAMVSPRYDFPSADSIPPVNIMVPETPSPRGSTNGQSSMPSGDGSLRPSAPPVPPRRPPPGRTPVAANARQPALHPAAPVAVGEAPTAGAGTPRPSNPEPSQ
jgi:hypothetical protein